jgi:hypothetical protein
MVLAPGQKAITYARSAIARSGVTRSGYYQLSLLMNIRRPLPGGGYAVDNYAAYILHGSLQVTHGSNDEVDTCSFTLIPQCPTIPQVGYAIVLSMGSTGAPEFSGEIVTVQHRRRVRNESPWIDVQCLDLQYRFDARFVTAEWQAQASATPIVIDLVSRFTKNFTLNNIDKNLPAVPRIEAINERPSTVLRRIATLIQGGFRIDSLGDVHFWAGELETGPDAPTLPQPLTDTLPTLKSFSRRYDATQLRTRVLVEGKRSEVLLGTPAYDTGTLGQVPVSESTFLGPLPTLPDLRHVRIGTQPAYMFAPNSLLDPPLDPTLNPPGSKTTAAVAAGAIAIPVEDITFAINRVSCWALIGDQYVWIASVDIPNKLILLPGSSGYGALNAPQDLGASITAVPSLYGVFSYNELTHPTPRPFPGQSLSAPVVLRVPKDDLAAQADWGTAEDTDGVREHLIQDGRLAIQGATERAEAELADFSRPLLTVEWETDDLNAHPGRLQVIHLGPPDPLDAELVITRTSVSFPLATLPPRRRCQAARVKRAQLLDVLLTDPR